MMGRGEDLPDAGFGGITAAFSCRPFAPLFLDFFRRWPNETIDDARRWIKVSRRMRLYVWL